MNTRAFSLSLVIAGMAMFMAWSYIDTQEAEYLKTYGNLQPVVVAKIDIKELELLDDSKVRLDNIPSKYVQPGHLKKIEEVYNTIATVPIKAGEQISLPRITQPGARTGLAHQVSVGKRAMSIRVGDETGVSKLIRPGDRVDIMALISPVPGQQELMKLKTIFQDVLILSTGYSITNSLPMVAVQRDDEIKKLNLNAYTDYHAVTVELTPNEVQRMTYLVSMSAKILLSLRNNDDKTIERLPATELYDVLGEDAQEARDFYSNKKSANGGANFGPAPKSRAGQ
ncbi:MAG: Flp pilus assembly protein CpaB [Bacteriovoracaceae bacterium]|nr:Flp pilus assembly protein CpaB [Bacteriovoracaceae bacterium]